MRSVNIAFLSIVISIYSVLLCKAQVPVYIKDANAGTGIYSSENVTNCKETSSSILLNSTKEKDDWQIVSGPVLSGMIYPFPAFYSKPFPSWEMDRYTPDSSYFTNCDWMVLSDKRTVVNTETRVPIVFKKKFTTNKPSKLKLIVKMLYDNMAYLYIDSTWIPLNHHNPDINRFIQKLQPELSGFVSIPATFNLSYNASFYAGAFYNLTLPQGDHTIRIELFNNAYELGCIIKGILMSADDEKIFCHAPVKEEQSELASILIYRDIKAFPGNGITDTLYAALMQSIKTGHWINNRAQNDEDLISSDTLFLKKGEKINVTPLYITGFYNGYKDTAYPGGSFKKITTEKAVKKLWDKTFVFDAKVPGTYLLEINCETPADARRIAPNLLKKYARIIKVK